MTFDIIYLLCGELSAPSVRAFNCLIYIAEKWDFLYYQAKALLEGRKANNAIMDKAYDADEVLNQIDSQGMTAVIPPKSNRKCQRDYDKHLYKERHLVECFINKIKHYRRIFSGFDKTARNFMSFIRFAAALIWLR